MRQNLYNKGFSLIELLVVVAILAMLLAIIMPALSKSKELIRRVVCASNQKQIVLAMVAYGEENDGWLANFSMPLPSRKIAVGFSDILNMYEFADGIVETALHPPDFQPIG